MIPLVAMAGSKGSGKSLVAQHLVRRGFRERAFAGPLKRAVAALFDFSDEQMYGSLKEVQDPRWGITPRLALQTIGTDFVRNQMSALMHSLDVGDGFFLKRFEMAWRPGDRVVLSDVRFADEADLVRRHGGVVILLQRPGCGPEHDAHESEQLTDLRPDAVVQNDGTIDELYDKVDRVLVRFAQARENVETR